MAYLQEANQARAEIAALGEAAKATAADKNLLEEQIQLLQRDASKLNKAVAEAAGDKSYHDADGLQK